jgi:3-oxoacyl-[acyl-carrier-protein] synthase-1
MTKGIVIIGVGIACPVGLCAKQAATSVRAGVARIEATAWIGQDGTPFKMARVPTDALPQLKDEIQGEVTLTQREQRLIRLGAVALNEALEVVSLESIPWSLFLALPELQTNLKLKPESFVDYLVRQAEIDVQPATAEVLLLGRAAGFVALDAAVKSIADNPDELAVVGGLDSYHDPYVLGTLQAADRVLTEESMDGLIPGEGAAFLLLTSSAMAQRHQWKVLATVESVAVGTEPGHLGSEESCTGDGSTKAIGGAVADGEPIQSVYVSFNGEHFWAKEWSVAFLRHAEHFREGHTLHHPADCYGDPGAAAGPLMAALAALNLDANGGLAPALIWCASDGELRSACRIGLPATKDDKLWP